MVHKESRGGACNHSTPVSGHTVSHPERLSMLSDRVHKKVHKIMCAVCMMAILSYRHSGLPSACRARSESKGCCVLPCGCQRLERCLHSPDRRRRYSRWPVTSSEPPPTTLEPNPLSRLALDQVASSNCQRTFPPLCARIPRAVRGVRTLTSHTPIDRLDRLPLCAARSSARK